MGPYAKLHVAWARCSSRLLARIALGKCDLHIASTRGRYGPKGITVTKRERIYNFIVSSILIWLCNHPSACCLLCESKIAGWHLAVNVRITLYQTKTLKSANYYRKFSFPTSGKQTFLRKIQRIVCILLEMTTNYDPDLGHMIWYDLTSPI